MRSREHKGRVYNATFEKVTISIYARYWTFEPRSFTEVDEFYLAPIETEHKNKGIILIEEGDDFSAKEKQALMNYRVQLKDRIQNYQFMLDEAKKKGATLEKPSEMIVAERWLKQIEERYSLAKEILRQDDSFLDLDKKESVTEAKPTIKAKKVEAQVAV